MAHVKWPSLLKLSTYEVGKVLKAIKERHFQNPALIPLFENIVADFAIKLSQKKFDGEYVPQDEVLRILKQEINGRGN